MLRSVRTRWVRPPYSFLNRDQKLWKEYTAIIINNRPQWGDDQGWFDYRERCDQAFAKRVAKQAEHELDRESLGYTGNKYYWMFGQYHIDCPEYFGDDWKRDGWTLVMRSKI